jgi:hypothetical protein
MDPHPANNPDSESNRQEVLERCRKLLSSALNLPAFDSDLSQPLLSAMRYVPLRDESARSSKQPVANGIHGSHYQPTIAGREEAELYPHDPQAAKQIVAALNAHEEKESCFCPSCGNDLGSASLDDPEHGCNFCGSQSQVVFAILQHTTHTRSWRTLPLSPFLPLSLSLSRSFALSLPSNPLYSTWNPPTLTETNVATGVDTITACNRSTCQEFVAKRSEVNASPRAPVSRAQYYWQRDFRICVTIKAQTKSVDANGMDPLLPNFQHKPPHTGRRFVVSV